MASLFAPLALLGPGEGEEGDGGLAGVREDLRITREEVAALRLRNVALEREIAHLPDLRGVRLLDPAEGAAVVPARVLCRDQDFPHRTVLLDRGARDGLEAGQPVMAGRSLVGLVLEVGPGSARVALLDEPGTRVRVEVVDAAAPAARESVAPRDPRREGVLVGGGVLRGSGRGEITLQFLPRGEVKPGDLVATALDTWRVPEGLLVGRVTEVRDLRRNGLVEASVEPFIDLGSLRTVYVLVRGAPDARARGRSGK